MSGNPLPDVWLSLLSAFPQAAASGGAILNAIGEAAAPTVICALPGQAVLSVSGPDAGKFLQGQTTTDFTTVSDSRSHLGCYVSLKGRAIASFRAVQQGEAIHLVMDAGLLGPVKDKLGKYIVFSKATLGTDQLMALGLAGEKAATLIAGLLGQPAPAGTDAVVSGNGLTAVRLHGDERFLLLCAPGKLADIWAALAKEATPAGENAWRLRQIAAGEASVTLAATELFQPQELNYQLLDGVSYSKGCYTGQEIVARLYFRGKLKQHVQRFAVKTTELPASGAALFAEGKHVADVVLAAWRDAGAVELLAVARPEHATGLRLGEGGPVLELLDLPYGVPAQE